MRRHKNVNSVMETRDHFKNGVSLKSLTSRRNFIKLAFFSTVSIVFFESCRARRTPRVVPIASFVEGDGGWTSVLISKNVKYELAFDDVLGIVTRNFEIDMISPEAGYLRTKWNTTYIKMSNGYIRKDYRVRITIKMSKERNKIDIHAQAERLIGDSWRSGYDTQLLETMRQDIAGVVGM